MSITSSAAIRRTDVMEYRPDSGSVSLRLDVEGPDDVAPLLRFVGDELAEVGGRSGQHGAAQIGEARLDLGIGECRIDFLVEDIDDLGRRVLGNADSLPSAGLIAPAQNRPPLEYQARCPAAWQW